MSKIIKVKKIMMYVTINGPDFKVVEEQYPEELYNRPCNRVATYNRGHEYGMYTEDLSEESVKLCKEMLVDKCIDDLRDSIEDKQEVIRVLEAYQC